MLTACALVFAPPVSRSPDLRLKFRGRQCGIRGFHSQHHRHPPSSFLCQARRRRCFISDKPVKSRRLRVAHSRNRKCCLSRPTIWSLSLGSRRILFQNLLLFCCLSLYARKDVSLSGAGCGQILILASLMEHSFGIYTAKDGMSAKPRCDAWRWQRLEDCVYKCCRCR